MIALVLCGLLAVGATPEEIDQARSYFEAGKQAFKAGQYMAAVTAFQEAHRIQPKAAIVFSMAQAFRLQYFIDKDGRKLRKAIQAYRKYIELTPSGGRREDAVSLLAQLEPMLRTAEPEPAREPAEETPTQLMVSSRTTGARASLDDGAGSEVPLIAVVDPGRHRVKVEAPGHYPESVDGVAVEGRLVVVEVNLRPVPARLDISAPSGANITIDGRLVGTAPLVEPLAVPAGRHYLVVTGRGRYPHTAELAVDRGQNLSLDVELESTVQRQIAYGFLAGAGALLAAGGATTGLAFMAQADADAIDQKLAGGQNLDPADVEAFNSAADRRDLLRITSGALYGGAVLAGATGLLLFLIDNPRVEERRTIEDELPVTPTIESDGLGATFRMRF